MTVATDRQVGFIKSLVNTRYKHFQAESAEAMFAAIPLDTMTREQVRGLIDQLLKTPEDRNEDMPDVVYLAERKGVNGSTGRCDTCKHPVMQGEGFYYGSRGAWKVHHKRGECPTEPVATTPVQRATEGFYRVGDKVYKVYMTQNRRLAAKALTKSGRWQYEAGAVRAVEAVGERLEGQDIADAICMFRWGLHYGTDELRQAAVQHGVQSGNCMFCERSLDDPRSNPHKGGVGYGPDCAKNYGLPWGVK